MRNGSVLDRGVMSIRIGPVLVGPVLVGLILAGHPSCAIAEDILRDPMRPHTTHTAPAQSTTRFTVNAIFIATDRRVAIVNGQRVTVGERVDGATVVSISRNELTLTIGSKHVTAQLTHGIR